MKTNPETAKIPFISVTASAEKREMRKALGLGADGYVRKPFDVRELMEAINNVIKK